MPDVQSDMLLLVKFRIWGSLRFISHAETLRVFQRACVRAATAEPSRWAISYSKGFNPRPKMSLPLPRPVGVETEEDMFCVGFDTESTNTLQEVPFEAERFTQELSNQLPEGCSIISIKTAPVKTKVTAEKAEYRFAVHCSEANEQADKSNSFAEQLRQRIKDILAGGSIIVRRKTGAGKVRDVDVRGFIESIEFQAEKDKICYIKAECITAQTGSIRIDEILDLLGIKPENLAEPVRRTKVCWRTGA